MSELAFFRAPNSLTLAAVAAEGGAQLPGDVDPSRAFRAAAPLPRAGHDDVSVFHELLEIDELLATRAGACFVAGRHLDRVPAGTVALVTDQPREAFRRLATMLHPGSIGPISAIENHGIDPTARVHPAARVEVGVVIDPGAIVGPDVEIGSGTFIGAHTVIGAGVRIGRNCAIDAHVTVNYALLGDRVLIHAGAKIGQGVRRQTNADGAGTPRLGRVIIQNDVEIGANAAIERGTLSDTVIGEASHIASHTSVEGSATVERDPPRSTRRHRSQPTTPN